MYLAVLASARGCTGCTEFSTSSESLSIRHATELDEPSGPSCRKNART